MNDSDKSAYPFQCHRCRSSSNPLVIYVLLASLYLAFVGHLYISCAWSGEVNNRLDHFSTRLEKFVSKLHRLAELQSAPDSSRKSRTKRFAPERDHWQSIFRWVDEENEENVSPNNRDRRAMTSQESENSAGQVDFFMQPQATDKQHPNFTWLTSYSRVPLSVLEEYCKSVQSHCLRGSPGPPGLQGEKGIKGDRGYPGPPGDIGPVGPLGPKGNKDGLDGLEGPPGLDGSPGMDGLPGRKGESGVNGIPGRNGTDGKPGQKGEPGENGIPGPKGKRGPPGAEGKPGITMTAWVHNDSLLLIAPSIDHANSTAQTITVKENEHFRLSCSASGQPSPTITWRREDGNPILRDGASYNAIESNQVNFSRISRDNMGSYLCVATNGVPPAATKLVNLLVTYPPLVKILLPKQMIGARMRSWAVLECYIEAYPEPFVDWIHGESRVLIDSDKYVRSEEPLEQRLSHVVSRRVLLNITYIESRDFGLYKCEARNHRGRTFGIITLYESDSKTVVDEKTLKESSFVLYGEIPKPVESKIKCEPCPECSPHLVSGGRGNQCQAGQRAAIVDLGSPEMQHRASWKLGQAAVECHLSQIGKPIFNGDYDNELGCWMRDPKPIRPGDENRYWLTRINLNDLLEQFENIDSFRNKQVERNYTLLHRFWGNAQTIYAGSFYYAKENTEKLIIFNLETSESAFINLEPRHHHPGRVKLPRKLLRHTRSQQHQERLSRARHEVINVEHKSLYTTQVNNTMDISADENGLWVVYPNIYSEMNSTIVVKFNGTIIDYVWNLTVDYHQLGDTFIMCGVLYGIESVNKLNTHISFAYNLYKQVELKHLEQIEFTNPFESTQYVGYNSRYQKLYTWDKGNILEYALKIDTNVAKLSKE